jgi:hypothetical protein
MGSPQPLTATAGPMGPARGVEAQGREVAREHRRHHEGKARQEDFEDVLDPKALQDASGKSERNDLADSADDEVASETAVLGVPVVMAEVEVPRGPKGGVADAFVTENDLETPVFPVPADTTLTGPEGEVAFAEPLTEADDASGRAIETQPKPRAASLTAVTETSGAVAKPDVGAATVEMNFAPSGGAGWKLVAEVAGKAPPAVATPGCAVVQPEAVTAQIRMGIARATGRRIEIRLDPPELGRVQIQLNPSERGVHAVILAERPEIGDLLRRHAEQLARDLAGAGYKDVTLEFSAGRQEADHGQDGPGKEQTFEAGFEPEARAEETRARPQPRSIAGGLDIRL